MDTKTVPDLKTEFTRVVKILDSAVAALHSDHPAEDDRVALRRILTEQKERDLGTRLHVERVASYAYGLLKAMGEEEDVARFLMNAIKLHDAGKIDMPQELLYNARKLTAEEFEQIKLHTVHGAERILNTSTGPLATTAAEIALYHHERLDGSGYHGLKGDDIPWFVRITAIADTFEAMTNETRSYQQAKTPEEALAAMQDMQNENDGEYFDQAAFDAFKDIAVDMFHKSREHKNIKALGEKAQHTTDIRSRIHGMKPPSGQ